MVVAIVVVLGVISLIGVAVAKPKGADLALFTSSAPNETVLKYWVANAVINEAEPNAFAKLIFNATGAAGEDIILAAVKKFAGGTWVGGRLVLTTHRVVFMPNRMNTALQKNLRVIALRLADITDVQSRFGMVTRIVDIRTAAGALSVRSSGTKAMIAAINEARGRTPA